MRILQVIHWFLPRHTAGSEVYTAQLSQELASRHQVAIYCREDGPVGQTFHQEEDVYQGIPVHRVYYSPPRGPLEMPAKAVTRFRNPWIERSFARYLREMRPHMVHFQHLFKLSGGLIRIARSMGIPTAMTLHDYWMLCYNGQLLRPGLRPCSGPLGGLKCPGCVDAPLTGAARLPLYPLLWPLTLYRTWWLRHALRGADAIISPSPSLAEVFVRHGFRRERILVSDNGTDMSWAADVRPTPSPKMRFGYIGTNHRQIG